MSKEHPTRHQNREGGHKDNSRSHNGKVRQRWRGRVTVKLSRMNYETMKKNMEMAKVPFSRSE
jgi:hypothetical protein